MVRRNRLTQSFWSRRGGGQSTALNAASSRLKGTQATTADGKPATEKVYSDRLLELLLKSRFPNDFVERRQVEHHHAPSGWQITAEDLHALSDSQVEQLQTIMETVMVARGETEPDLAMGTALIDVTPETIETEPDDSERLNPYRG